MIISQVQLWEEESKPANLWELISRLAPKGIIFTGPYAHPTDGHIILVAAPKQDLP